MQVQQILIAGTIGVIGYIAMEAFLSGILEQSLGGLIGAMVFALLAFYVAPKWSRSHAFSIQFLDVDESITPENMAHFGIAELSIGKSQLRVRLRARNGANLEILHFAFFDVAARPWATGRRRAPQEICITKLHWAGNKRYPEVIKDGPEPPGPSNRPKEFWKIVSPVNIPPSIYRQVLPGV